MILMARSGKPIVRTRTCSMSSLRSLRQFFERGSAGKGRGRRMSRLTPHLGQQYPLKRMSGRRHSFPVQP
jgi:hypothetical protein